MQNKIKLTSIANNYCNITRIKEYKLNCVLWNIIW